MNGELTLICNPYLFQGRISSFSDVELLGSVGGYLLFWKSGCFFPLLFRFLPLEALFSYLGGSYWWFLFPGWWFDSENTHFKISPYLVWGELLPKFLQPISFISCLGRIAGKISQPTSAGEFTG